MIELYNTDSIEYMKTLPSESISLIVTDPPYKITARGSSGTMGGYIVNDLSKKGNIFEHNDIQISDYAPEFYRLLKDGSHCYVMTNNLNLIEMLNTFTECGFHFIKSLIWDKGNKISGQYYMSQFEYILFFRKGKGIPINNCGTSDILSIPIKKLKNNSINLHDTEKPVELMKILIANSSKELDVVLDPFMGIGSTGIACKQLNRNFIGCEIDKKFYDIANRRFNEENLIDTNDISLFDII